jgi:hypothetical protein
MYSSIRANRSCIITKQSANNKPRLPTRVLKPVKAIPTTNIVLGVIAAGIIIDNLYPFYEKYQINKEKEREELENEIFHVDLKIKDYVDLDDDIEVVDAEAIEGLQDGEVILVDSTHPEDLDDEPCIVDETYSGDLDDEPRIVLDSDDVDDIDYVNYFHH